MPDDDDYVFGIADGPYCRISGNVLEVMAYWGEPAPPLAHLITEPTEADIAWAEELIASGEMENRKPLMTIRRKKPN